MAKQKLAKERTSLTVALVGEETLLGRELKEVIQTRGASIVLDAYAANGEGNFADRDGETVYIRPLEGSAVRDAAAILLAGTEEGAVKAYAASRENHGKPLVIDCTGFLETRPEARFLAPLLDEPKWHSEWLLVLAHPAASAIALVLTRVAKYRPLRNSVVHAFEPASERGKSGLTELHQQTTSLLNFKGLDKHVFDAQLAFNMLPEYGEDAPLSLATVEHRIDREIGVILNRRANGVAIPRPSFRLSQAPVFHGYSFSLWLEFESEIQAAELEEALASAQIEVRRKNEEAPNNAAAASQSGLIAGNIRVDSVNPRAAWLWIAADNLRLTADAAMDILRVLQSEHSR